MIGIMGCGLSGSGVSHSSLWYGAQPVGKSLVAEPLVPAAIGVGASVPCRHAGTGFLPDTRQFRVSGLIVMLVRTGAVIEKLLNPIPITETAKFQTPGSVVAVLPCCDSRLDPPRGRILQLRHRTDSFQHFELCRISEMCPRSQATLQHREPVRSNAYWNSVSAAV